MEPLLSIVIPCFNVENYLQNCLDSIYDCDMSEKEFEVVCVNDASTDDTAKVIHRNSLGHTNLKVVTHSSNRGWGGARNSGLDNSSGKYLWFVDADDFVVPEKIVGLIRKCQEGDLDVCAFNYKEVYEDKSQTSCDRLVFRNSDVLNGVAFAKKHFGCDFVNHAGYVWRFIYSVDFLKHTQLYFPEKVCWEDTVYMPKSILLADRVQSVSDICYNYRRNAASISGQYHKQYRAELICQMAFCAGRDLLDYSNEIPDKELSDAFRKKAISMINGFKIHLLRTSGTQRRRFYHILDEFQVENLKPQMTAESKFCLNRFFGQMFVGVLAWVYGVKHKK